MQWISRTAAMMDLAYKNEASCTVRIESIAKKLRTNLSAFENANAAQGLSKDLLKVVSSACELDFKMAKSNAQYIVFMYSERDTSPNPPTLPKYGMPFDLENMEETFCTEEADRTNRTIDIIRSPGIIKIGTGLGSEYGVATILVKRRVVCLPQSI